MDYQEEDKEDKKYKKGYSRKEFKKDVAEAVRPEIAKAKGKKKLPLYLRRLSRLLQEVRAPPTPKCQSPSCAST